MQVDQRFHVSRRGILSEHFNARVNSDFFYHETENSKAILRLIAILNSTHYISISIVQIHTGHMSVNTVNIIQIVQYK